MPTFMDRHDMANATGESVARAHIDDLAVQDEYGVNFLTYWFDYERQTTFCLVQAPDAETVSLVHQSAHGDVPGQVIRVEDSEVDAFLGRITDPSDTTDPIAEPAFRTVVFTDIAGSTEVHDRLGDEAAMGFLRRHNAVVRAALHNMTVARSNTRGTASWLPFTKRRMRYTLPSTCSAGSRQTPRAPDLKYESGSTPASPSKKEMSCSVSPSIWQGDSAIAPTRARS